MKRPCEDSGSANEVESGQRRPSGHAFRCSSPSATTQLMARKKRRGVIEKRRRDRINNSLLELRRLIPAAFEKQGSAKLEKAEILQMTVDHLKMLQASGGKGYLDAEALDLLSLGFRECVTEVSCYLSSVEALDAPLRSRLLSHLASCASQRDAAARLQSHPFPPQHWALRPLPYGLPASLDAAGGGGGAPQRLMEMSQHSVTSSSPPSSSSSLMLPCPPTPLSGSLFSFSASFPITLHGGFPFLPPSSFTSAATSPPISSSSSSQTPHSSCSSKPHRPWGEGGGSLLTA